MSQQTITKCDNCGKQKGETNHWYGLAYNPRKGIHILRERLDETSWNNGDYELYDACGETCILEMISKRLGANNVGGNKIRTTDTTN